MIQTDRINPASFRNFGMAILTQPFSFDLWFSWATYARTQMRLIVAGGGDPGLNAAGYSRTLQFGSRSTTTPTRCVSGVLEVAW